MSLEVAIAHARGAFALDVAFRTEGRLTALFGPSGSGKTTVVDAIAGLVRPSRGLVRVDGATLLDTVAGIDRPPHRRGIGYVFQEGRLFPHLTVRQNLLFGRVFARARRPGAPSLDAVVTLLGLDALLARRPAHLSGGEKQRVAIGRALLAHPRLLLMDEPLAALDEARKAEILPFVERLRDEAGVPVVYVSHALAEVARLADAVVLLDAGRVVAAGPTAAILDGRPGLPLRDDEAGAVLEGRVAAHDTEYGLSRVKTPAGDLFVPGVLRPVGATVRALVRARDVMLCLEKPRGVSALNVLPGTVVALGAPDAAWIEVGVACGEARLVARVTRRSAAELGLAPGRAVYAAVKSVSLDEGRPTRRR
jgi:molybdate transport system ATP-binding protein